MKLHSPGSFPMRILMLHNRYLIRGGEDEVTDSEIALLRQYGCQVDLLELDNQAIARNNLFQTGIDTIWSRASYRMVKFQLQNKPYDLVHIQNFFPLFSPSVHHAAKSTGLPVVQVLHNYRLLCLNGLFYRHGRVCEDCLGRSIPLPGVVHSCYRASRMGSMVVAGMLTAHRFLRTWQQQVDMFYTLSEFARDKLIAGGLPAARIIVKPNFVYPDPGPSRKDQRDFILLVSRLEVEKGILTTLRAWQDYDLRIPLKIVGDGPLASSIEAAARQMPYIEYLGRKKLDEVLDLMGKAHLVLFPTNWYETFGRVIIEAYSRETPVLVSDIGAGSTLVDEGRTGLHFRHGDAGDLAEKVRWAWEHAREIAEMGRNARGEYEEKYTAEKNFQMLMEIYQKAISLNKEGKT